MTSPRLAKIWILGASMAFAVLLGGCATGRTVTGRVLEGKASVVTVVNTDDNRLQTQGVAGVRVRLTRGDSTSSSIAETTTLTDGSFSLTVDEQYLVGRLEVVASGPTVLTCRGSVYLPSDDRQVLVIVEPGNSQGVGERSR
jgi:hypothetical protein